MGGIGRGGMAGFIIRRVLLGIPVLFLTVLVTFLLIRLVPGGPFDTLSSVQPPAWLKAAFNARYGLDKPLFLNLPDDGIAPDYGMDMRVPYERLPNCDKLSQGIPAAQAIDAQQVEVSSGWYLIHLVQEHYSSSTTITDKNGPRSVPCDAERTILYSDLTRSQFFEYVDNLLRFDFGPSLGRQTLGTPVSSIISERMPVSTLLGVVSVLISFILGIPLGVIAAVYQNSIVDYSATLLAVVFASVPSFVLGPVLLLFFVGNWHILPGPYPPVWKSPDFLDWNFLGRALLPFLTLGIPGCAGLARLTRATMLQVLDDDYVRTARSKGMRERGVLYIHALRNALIPIVTIIGPLLAGVLLGSFFIEQIFGIPGLGDSFIVAEQARDYNLLTGISLLYSLFLILGNILVDIMYTWLDPRIRFS